MDTAALTKGSSSSSLNSLIIAAVGGAPAHAAVAIAIKVAAHWERAVLLRLGMFRSLDDQEGARQKENGSVRIEAAL